MSHAHNFYNAQRIIASKNISVSCEDDYILRSFNCLFFKATHKYTSEKDMPDDVFINYCLFKNKMKELFNIE